MKPFTKRMTTTLLASMLLCGTCFTTACTDNSDASGSSAESSADTQSSSTNANTPEESNDDTITVIDHDDRTVTLPANIQRIVVADIYPLPSVLSVFFDSADKIVGMAQPSMTAAQNSLLGELYPEILEAKTDFIDGTSINLEELMQLAPDVVFYSAGSSEVQQALENAGIPAVGISAGKWDFNAIETLNHWIELFGQMFPANDKTEVCRNYTEKMYNRVQERVKDLTEHERIQSFFLFQYNDATITTSGKHFFGQFWADASGAINVGAEMDTVNSTAVNMEQIYTWNPDVIFITNFNAAQPDDLYQNTIGTYDWSAIAAVQNKRIYKMPLGMYRSYTPGVDTPITLLWIAKTTYPELFSDVDITQETKNYYKEIFGVELTDAQANQIFAPISEASAF